MHHRQRCPRLVGHAEDREEALSRSKGFRQLTEPQYTLSRLLTPAVNRDDIRLAA